VQKLVQFGHVVFEKCERTDRLTQSTQTDVLMAILRPPIEGEVNI